MRAWGDPELAKAADRALDKVQTALPERLQRHLGESSLFVPRFFSHGETAERLARLRGAARKMRKVRLSYLDAKGAASDRVVAPLGLFFWGKVWTLATWCELRQDYRDFRVDRIRELHVLADSYAGESGRNLDGYFRHR